MSVIIKEMTATFGGLDNATLTLGEGLTVITAPNETGKSTWAAFVRAMFYGIDTKDRDKTGYLADKNRYQPWSGAPIRGEIRLEWEGRDITLLRTSTRTAPMGQFEAVYTASGDPVPGLTGVNVGEKLLGVGREVFVRSALVGQNAAVLTAAPELEQRIAALATTGQEEVSASAVQRTLKDWRNRRRLNRANGLIPQLEQELQQTEAALRELAQARSDKEEAQARLDALAEQRKELEFQQELHRKLAVKELNRRCGEALARWEEARGQLEQLPAADPAFEGCSAEEAAALEADLRRQAEERRILADRSSLRAALQLRRNRTKALFKLVVGLFGFGGLVLVIAGFVAKFYTLSYIGFGCMFATVAAAIVFVLLLGSADQKLAALTDPEPAPETPIPDAAAYGRWLTQRARLEQEERHCRERYEDLLAQGAQPLNTLELLPQPTCSPAETAARLASLDREIALWQSRRDRAIGALRRDPTELEARCATLESQLEQRTGEYDAIDLAMNAMERANAALRERFSPALNKEAAELFSVMTGGSYSQLTLSRDLSATVEHGGPRSALYLSAGTVDQLYLSVRLALCKLTAPGVPMLLDDALCTFDDERMTRALELLKELAAERQILLFSCHDREAAWADAHDIPAITL